MTTKKQHGRQRKGYSDIRKTLTLPMELVKYLVIIGGGNLSAGVRLVAEYHKVHTYAMSGKTFDLPPMTRIED